VSEISRRKWLRGIVPAAADTVAQAAGVSIAMTVKPQRRPPGARPEPEFLALCTRCTECADACPHHAVLAYNDKAGKTLAGTPIMRPERRVCEMCEGFPCARACPEGALVVPDASVWWLGAVRIRADRCIAFMGPECGACTGLCPPDAPAMSVIRDKPELDVDACVGCGRCIHACPTTPRAIEMVPLVE